MKLRQLNAVSHVKQLHYRLFSTRKAMTGKSLNRSLLCLPLKKHLLNSPSLLLEDTSCSLISCLQLYSRSHLMPERREAGQAKAIPPEEVQTTNRPLTSTGPLTCCPPHNWGGMSCSGVIISIKKLTKTWTFTHQHPNSLRSLMFVALGPSNWLIFRALHPLEHNLIIENKLASANRFINYGYAPNIYPSFKYSRRKGFAVSCLRNLKHLSHKLCLEELLQLLSRQNIPFLLFLHAQHNTLLLQPRMTLSAYSLDVPAIGIYHLRPSLSDISEFMSP